MQRPSLKSTLTRILRLKCPRCGRGKIYARPFLRADRCTNCAWQYERGEGYWVGGSEVHMFVSYGLSVILCVPFLVIFDASLAAKIGVIVGHMVLSVAVFHFSRATFLGLDYLIDPGDPKQTDGDDPNDGNGDRLPIKPTRPSTPKSTTRRRRKARMETGSDRPREPVDV